MFEGLIEQLILAYLGDYIENLDRNKLNLGVNKPSNSIDLVMEFVTRKHSTTLKNN